MGHVGHAANGDPRLLGLGRHLADEQLGREVTEAQVAIEEDGGIGVRHDLWALRGFDGAVKDQPHVLRDPLESVRRMAGEVRVGKPASKLARRYRPALRRPEGCACEASVRPSTGKLGMGKDRVRPGGVRMVRGGRVGRTRTRPGDAWTPGTAEPVMFPDLVHGPVATWRGPPVGPWRAAGRAIGRR